MAEITKEEATEMLFESLEGTGNLYLLTKAIKFGADINSKNDKEMTPLIYATRKINNEITINHEAAKNPDGSYYQGEWPADMTDGSFFKPEGFYIDGYMIVALIEAGANIHEKDEKENTGLMRLLDVAKYRYTKSVPNLQEALMSFIEHGYDVNIRNSKNENLLIKTLEIFPPEEAFNITNLLIQKGIDVNIASECGATPLIELLKGKTELCRRIEVATHDLEYSIQNNHEDDIQSYENCLNKDNDENIILDKIIDMLITHGADIGAIEKHTSVYSKGFDVWAKNPFKDTYHKTPLYYACKMEDVKLIKLLFEKGAVVEQLENLMKLNIFAEPLETHKKEEDYRIKEYIELASTVYKEWEKEKNVLQQKTQVQNTTSILKSISEKQATLLEKFKKEKKFEKFGIPVPTDISKLSSKEASEIIGKIIPPKTQVVNTPILPSNEPDIPF